MFGRETLARSRVLTSRLPASTKGVPASREPAEPPAASVDPPAPSGRWARVARITCRKAAALMGCSGLDSRAPTRPGSEPSARVTVSATLATVLLGRIPREGTPPCPPPDPGRSSAHDLRMSPGHRLALADLVPKPRQHADRRGLAVLPGRGHPAQPTLLHREAAERDGGRQGFDGRVDRAARGIEDHQPERPDGRVRRIGDPDPE